MYVNKIAGKYYCTRKVIMWETKEVLVILKKPKQMNTGTLENVITH